MPLGERRPPPGTGTWPGLASHGYGQSTKQERFGEPRQWLTDGKTTQPPPSEIKLAEALLAGTGRRGDGQDRVPLHIRVPPRTRTRLHAFTLFMPAHTQYDPQTPDAVPLGVSPQDLTTWLMVMTLAVHTASVRTGDFFGWDIGEWVATVEPLLSDWATSVRSTSV